ncbi:tetratricopeptide repeat protein [Novosphingobium sp. SL115]|uniref:SPOR domain-containing protein n=1 Tax=Novosphingobium sp. SL115 TaxID=2995150 RepID=UPI0022741C07|nr:SPOR domain-containing protein [Novosphingobium sp. SL115]MCY1672323.1 tetratricopeptide repeat protein [Novosphingobium sp. SL115]
MTNRFTYAQGFPKSAALAVGLLLAAASPRAMAQADDDLDGPVTVSRPVVQSIAPSPSRDLNAALSRLAADPRNTTALFDAAEAALRMGDSDAAIGFLTRANEVQPGNARSRMLMGKAYLADENPVDAVRAFDDAERAGADTALMAADRGLAYDLVGDNGRAQRWYQVALAKGADDDVTRHYAMSLAISGDRRGAEALLAPLIQKQDRATWRTRTFVMAVTGGPDEAVAIAYASMPQELASGIAPYLRYMPRLTPAQQAAAANFGRFPRAADIGRDDPRVLQYAALNPRLPRAAEAGLIPVGAPLGLAKAKAVETASHEKRRRPGKGDEKIAIVKAISRPLPVSPSSASPLTPAPDALAAAAPVRSSPVPARVPASPRPTVLSVLDVPPGAVRPAFTAPGTSTPLPPSATPTAVVAPKPAPVPAKQAPVLPPAQMAAQTVAPPITPPAAVPVVSTAPSGFDLAKLGGSTEAATATTAVPALPSTQTLSVSTPSPSVSPPAAVAIAAAPPQPAVPAVLESAGASEKAADFSSLFKSFTPPPEEKQVQTAAVDITRLPPKTAPQPPRTDPRGERPDGPADVSRIATKEVEKPAAKDQRPAKAAKDAKDTKDAKAKKVTPSHPSRIWVQVLTGANKAVMHNEWNRLVKEAPAVLRGRKPYLSPWRSNFRLLTGPFESEAVAQEFIGKLRKSGVSSYQWTSPAGQAVDSLALK